MNNVLLITVTKVEAESVLNLFPKATGVHWDRQYIRSKPYYFLGNLGGAEIRMVQCEMGAVGPGAALVTVMRAIQDFSPIAVIMVGIAFGVDPLTQKLGDILVSRQIRSYEQQKIRGRRLIPRGDRVTVSPRLLGLFRSGDLDWLGAKVHFGVMLSGEKLIMSRGFKDQLIRLEPESIGGEMEGAGVYTAASEAKVDWILVKAICDWADESKNYDSQSMAAHNAVNFVIHVIKQGGLSGLGSKLANLDSVSITSESRNAEFPDIAIVTTTGINNGAADTTLLNKANTGKTFPISASKPSPHDSQHPYDSVNEYTVKQNPNDPCLIPIVRASDSVRDNASAIIRLQHQNCYWGRAANSDQLDEYLEMKSLTNSPIDSVSLPPLVAAKGNVSPVAWMQVYEHFSQLYSGWGNRLPLEEISVIDKNNRRARLRGNGPFVLRGFETIHFMGEPEVKQVYIHPIAGLDFAPTIHDVEFMENHGLWVYAGYAWLNLSKFEAALTAFERAILKGLDHETKRQVQEKINLLKRST